MKASHSAMLVRIIMSHNMAPVCKAKQRPTVRISWKTAEIVNSHELHQTVLRHWSRVNAMVVREQQV